MDASREDRLAVVAGGRHGPSRARDEVPAAAAAGGVIQAPGEDEIGVRAEPAPVFDGDELELEASGRRTGDVVPANGDEDARRLESGLRYGHVEPELEKDVMSHLPYVTTPLRQDVEKDRLQRESVRLACETTATLYTLLLSRELL